MWQQDYIPVGGSLAASTLAAGLPVFVLLYLLGVKRKPAWVASLLGSAAALPLALIVYRMPAPEALSAAAFGAAFGLMPIGLILFSALFVYRISIETGKFEIIKHSLGSLTSDRRLQALLIGYALGGFMEGAAGFGAPVAVTAAMLVGLGFPPLYAAGVCLLSNTVPVAFGSIGIPMITLASVTGLPLNALSASVGRICSPLAVVIPAYVVMVMGGWKALRGVLPAVLLSGVAFGGVEFAVSNFIGPQLAAILGALAAILSLVVLLLLWKPKDSFELPGATAQAPPARQYSTGDIVLAWSPYGLIVLFVLLWGWTPIRTHLLATDIPVPWPGLHNQILRMPPVVKIPTPYAATYNFTWLSGAGTSVLLAAIAAAVLLRVSFRQFFGVLGKTARQVAIPELTLAAVLALAYLMNYCGATVTMGLAFAATGSLFPFFSPFLGWLGVFLTGSDTSANALFGNLQVVTAGRLNFSPILMAAANSSGGVVGKMISLQSIAVAAAATGFGAKDESSLFRFALKHSVILITGIGLLTALYAYTGWAG
jgi:L-lactate transport